MTIGDNITRRHCKCHILCGDIPRISWSQNPRGAKRKYSERDAFWEDAFIFKRHGDIPGVFNNSRMGIYDIHCRSTIDTIHWNA